MKKFLLFAAAAVLSSASAFAQWAVVGAYTDPNWDFGASTKFEGEGDNLSCTIDYLIGDFKLVDITNNNWDIQYGTATPLTINTEIELQGKNGGPDPANMKFEELVLGVKNVTVKWNPTTHIMVLEANESDVVYGYPELWVTGSFNGWITPGDDDEYKCTVDEGLYSVTFDLGTDVNDDGYIEFKLAGKGWSNEMAGGVVVGLEPVNVTRGGENLLTELTGVKTLWFDYSGLQMWFEDADDASVGEIETTDAPAVYFNLQGVRVDNPEKGIFIVKKGNVASKVVL